MEDKKIKIKISSPWVKFYREIECLFKGDPDVNVTFDEENNTIKLYVNGAAKADALTALLPSEKEFGNVKVKICVVPANKPKLKMGELFETAFEGNPVLSYTKTIDGVMTNPLTYVVLKKEVVQFFNDNLNDIHGLETTLYQTIAKDVFDGTGVFFCTDIC